MSARFDRSQFHIGTYYLAPYASTPRHVRDAADCGIDFIVCMRPDYTALDLLHENGISAVVSGLVPGWAGCDGKGAGEMAQRNPLSAYDEAAKNFVDHPAICGVDAGDEPSCLDFPHYGRVIERINALFPNQFAYLNLFPSYGFKGWGTADERLAQLGCSSYGDYISQYVNNVPTDYICFDYYVYSADVRRFYETLRIVAEACKRTNRDLFAVLQVNSHLPDVYVSENQLRYQAFSAMAFGAKTVIWACYTAGWWHNQVLDKQGEKTQQYDKLRTVNHEIRALSDAYLRYTHVDTHFVGDFPKEALASCDTAAVAALDTVCFQNVRAEHGEALLIGQRTAPDGSEALFICAADDPYDRAPHAYSVIFSSDCTQIEALGDGHPLPVTRLEDGTCSVFLSSCHSVLIQAHAFPHIHTEK